MFEAEPGTRRLTLHERPGAVEAVGSREPFLTRAMANFRHLNMVAAFLFVGAILTAIMVPLALFDLSCLPGWTCSGDTIPRWGATLLGLLGAGVFALGLYLARAFVLAGGDEFLRVESGEIVHGFRRGAEESLVVRYGFAEIDELAAADTHLAGRKHGASVQGFFPRSAPDDLRRIAPLLSAGIREPTHADRVPHNVRVRDRPDGGTLTVSGARWGRLAAVFVAFVAPFLLVLYLGFEKFANEGDGVALVLAILFFSGAMGVFAFVGLRIGPVPTVIEIRAGELRVRRGPFRSSSRFARRPRVSYDQGNLYLIEGKRKVKLGFERLEPEERPNVVPLLSRLVERAWPET